MDNLTEAQLKRLYFDYVAYRESLPPMQLPIGVKEFFDKNKANYIEATGE